MNFHWNFLFQAIKERNVQMIRAKDRTCRKCPCNCWFYSVVRGDEVTHSENEVGPKGRALGSCRRQKDALSRCASAQLSLCNWSPCLALQAPFLPRRKINMWKHVQAEISLGGGALAVLSSARPSLAWLKGNLRGHLQHRKSHRQFFPADQDFVQNALQPTINTAIAC